MTSMERASDGAPAEDEQDQGDDGQNDEDCPKHGGSVPSPPEPKRPATTRDSGECPASRAGCKVALA